jgi:hypothetical protein
VAGLRAQQTDEQNIATQLPQIGAGGLYERPARIDDTLQAVNNAVRGAHDAITGAQADVASMSDTPVRANLTKALNGVYGFWQQIGNQTVNAVQDVPKDVGAFNGTPALIQAQHDASVGVADLANLLKGAADAITSYTTGTPLPQ